MKYISTRGNSGFRDFSDVIISGTAEDGGLYLPEIIPDLKLSDNMSYIDLATEITSLFARDIKKEVIRECYINAYSTFKNGIVPIEKVDNDLYLAKLYQGPTLSFKDYALGFLGNIVDYILNEKGLKKQIITATSGDTGPAAIYGFKNCKQVSIKVYYPDKNVSAMQREQMTSIKQDNIEAIGLDCTFDDCQKLVKNAFASDKTGSLMTVNSINMGRIVAQIVYYVYIYLKLGKKPLNFFVPTGNVGNICAGYMAKLLLRDNNIKLSICVNENDTLYRFYNTNIYEPRKVIATLANAIDIAHPSNFERLLYYLSNDKNDVNKYIEEYKQNNKYKVNNEFIQNFKDNFDIYRVSSDNIVKTQEKYNGTICPHTAVALYSASQNKNDSELKVVLATADPVKFK
jgi:threonine synthase